MEEIKKVLTIQTSEGERSVKSLRKEISDMRDALLNVEKGSQDWEDISKKLIKAQEDLTSVTKLNKKTVEAAADSIVGMERQYKSLYDTYKLLSEEQRKSQFGKEMAAQLETLSNKLNDTKKEVGNYKDNIGRYTQGVMDAFAKMGASAKALQNPMKAASMGVKAVGSSMKTLAANPVGATLLALVTIFSKLSTAIKGNEELQRSMNKVMAAFKPIGDAVAIVFDKIAGLAVKVAEGTAKVVTWFTRLTKAGRQLADAEAEVAEMQDELIDKKREYETLNAADEAEIAALREKTAETENQTEKQKYLNEAMEIQNRVNDRNVDLRQQEYDMIKKRNAISPSSTEAIEEEADALKALNETREESSRKNTELQKQLNNVTKSKKKNAEEWKKAIQEIQDAGKTASEQEIARYNKEVEELKKTLKEKEGSLKGFNEAVKTLQYRHQTNMIQIQREVSDRTREMEYNLIPFPSKQYYEKKLDELEEFYVEVGSFVYATDYFEKNFGKQDNGLWKEFDDDTKKTIYAHFGFNVDNLEQLKMQVKLVRKEISQTLGEYGSYTLDSMTKQVDVSNKKIAAQLSDDYLAIVKATAEFPYDWLSDVDEMGQRAFSITELERSQIEERLIIYKGYYDAITKLEEGKLKESEDNTFIETQVLNMGLSERLEYAGNYFDTLKELRDYDIDHYQAYIDRNIDLNLALQDSYIDLFDTVADHLTTVTNLWQNSIQTQLQDGKITEKEAKRKKNIFKTLEAITLTVNLAQIAGSTASGIMDVWKSYAGELVANAETAAATGPAAAATKAALDAKSLVAANIRTATLATAGATSAAAAIAGSIANFKSINGMDGGGGTGVSGVPSLNDTNPFAYTRNVTTASEEERLNQPTRAYVVESDITAKQELSSKRNQESTF